MAAQNLESDIIGSSSYAIPGFEDETTSLLHNQRIETYSVFDESPDQQDTLGGEAVVALGANEMDKEEEEEEEEEEEGRTIYVNDRRSNAQFQYPTNKTTTTKYTWWNFPFKNLYEQASVVSSLRLIFNYY